MTQICGEHTCITVEVDGQEFQVTTCSNTTIMNVTVNKGEKALIFNVRGYGKSGFCNVTIPKSMMWGENWEIYIDGIPLSEEYYSITEDSENIYNTHRIPAKLPRNQNSLRKHSSRI